MTDRPLIDVARERMREIGQRYVMEEEVGRVSHIAGYEDGAARERAADLDRALTPTREEG
jgi:hypothetical protein